MMLIILILATLLCIIFSFVYHFAYMKGYKEGCIDMYNDLEETGGDLFNNLKIKKMKNAVKNIEKDGKLVAIEVPIINVRIDLEDISSESMTWDQAMDYARSKGKRLLTKEEVGILIYLKDQLPESLKRLWFWTSSEYEGDSQFRYAFRVYYASYVLRNAKYYSCYVVPVSDLTT